MKHRFKKSAKLIKVDQPKIGELYHVAWAYSRGVIGRCIAIDEQAKTVTLRRPKTRTEFKTPVKFDDLRHTRKNQVKIKRQTP